MASSYLTYQDLLETLVSGVLEQVDDGRPSPIVLIDGRAGSGKSTVAEKLQNELFRQGESMPRIIHMDDLYEGWDGLAAGAEYLQRFILKPLADKQTATWQEYNWELGKRDRWREFSGGTPLIIEGCGAVNLFTAELASFSVWLEVSEETRRQRWQERDGSRFDEFFDNWAAQELDFYATQRSRELAQLELLSPAVD